LINIQGQKAAKPPETRPAWVPPAVAASFGAQAVQVEHDLNRPSVKLA
jgi:hypothetical protein